MINPKYYAPMKSIKSRYQLLNISGNTKVLTDEEFKNNKQGYIYVPYIIAQSTTILEEGDWLRILREREIQQRREKIEKLKDKIYGLD
jgi:hypothetical protein